MKKNKGYIYLSIIVSALILLSGAIGIYYPEIYENEAFDWQVQAVWQDYFDVFLIVPLLIISGSYAFYGSVLNASIWCGTLFYVVYAYIIYAFDIHFNRLFYLYCLILGSSFYALVWYYYMKLRHIRAFIKIPIHRSWLTGTYFIVLGSVFYIIWLADIIPAIMLGQTPPQLDDFQIPTNPVHVIDLSIVLPAYIITGVMINLKVRSWKLFAPPLLIFAVLMSLTIGSLQLLLYLKNYESILVIAIVMFMLAIFDIFLLINTFGWKKKPIMQRDKFIETAAEF